MKKIATYVTHLGNELRQTERHGGQVCYLMFVLLLVVPWWLGRVLRRIAREMYSRKVPTPYWRRKAAAPSPFIDAVVLVAVLAMVGLLWAL